MPAGSILPDTIGPYVTMMIVGFVVGAFGHLVRSRWLVGIGILLVFLAALGFPLALNLFSDHPESPGPLHEPY